MFCRWSTYSRATPHLAMQTDVLCTVGDEKVAYFTFKDPFVSFGKVLFKNVPLWNISCSEYAQFRPKTTMCLNRAGAVLVGMRCLRTHYHWIYDSGSPVGVSLSAILGVSMSRLLLLSSTQLTQHRSPMPFQASGWSTCWWAPRAKAQPPHAQEWSPLPGLVSGGAGIFPFRAMLPRDKTPGKT